jgi:catechol 2,3-dioxygenase-like lactoylglutathione lyase family enzyme
MIPRAALFCFAVFLAGGCVTEMPSDERPSQTATGPSDPLTLGGTQFLAVSVDDLETSRQWYQSTFELRTTMDQTSADSSVHTVVMESPSLVVELSEHRAAQSLEAYAGRPTPTFLVHGFFKGALLVADLDSAVAVLQAREVDGLSPIRADTTSASRFAFLRDPDGNFLQFLERGWRP